MEEPLIANVAQAVLNEISNAIYDLLAIDGRENVLIRAFGPEGNMFLEELKRALDGNLNGRGYADRLLSLLNNPASGFYKFNEEDALPLLLSTIYKDHPTKRTELKRILEEANLLKLLRINEKPLPENMDPQIAPEPRKDNEKRKRGEAISGGNAISQKRIRLLGTILLAAFLITISDIIIYPILFSEPTITLNYALMERFLQTNQNTTKCSSNIHFSLDGNIAFKELTIYVIDDNNENVVHRIPIRLDGQTHYKTYNDSGMPKVVPEKFVIVDNGALRVEESKEKFREIARTTTIGANKKYRLEFVGIDGNDVDHELRVKNEHPILICLIFPSFDDPNLVSFHYHSPFSNPASGGYIIKYQINRPIENIPTSEIVTHIAANLDKSAIVYLSAERETDSITLMYYELSEDTAGAIPLAGDNRYSFDTDDLGQKIELDNSRLIWLIDNETIIIPVIADKVVSLYKLKIDRKTIRLIGFEKFIENAKNPDINKNGNKIAFERSGEIFIHEIGKFEFSITDSIREFCDYPRFTKNDTLLLRCINQENQEIIYRIDENGAMIEKYSNNWETCNQINMSIRAIAPGYFECVRKDIAEEPRTIAFYSPSVVSSNKIGFLTSSSWVLSTSP